MGRAYYWRRVLENLPRMFPSSLVAEIQLNSWPVLPILN